MQTILSAISHLQVHIRCDLHARPLRAQARHGDPADLAGGAASPGSWVGHAADGLVTPSWVGRYHADSVTPTRSSSGAFPSCAWSLWPRSASTRPGCPPTTAWRSARSSLSSTPAAGRLWRGRDRRYLWAASLIAKPV